MLRPRSDGSMSLARTPSIRKVVQQRAMPAYRDVPIVRAELGDRAGLIGAASLILWEGEPGLALAMAQDDSAATTDAREASHG